MKKTTDSSRSTIKNVSFIGLSNVFSIISSLLGSFIVARYLSPADFGSVKAFFILNSYFAVSHMGIFDGMSRQIPLYLGKGDKSKAMDYASTGYAFILFGSLIFGSVYIVFSGYHLIVSQDTFRAFGWFMAGLLYFFTQITGCLGVTYRTTSDFAKIAIINSVANVFSLIGIGFVIYFSSVGLLIRNAVTATVSTVLYNKYRPLKAPIHFKKEYFKELIKIGLPLYISGYLGTSFWVAFDATLAVKFLSSDEFGVYSFLLVIYLALNTFAMSVKQIYVPKITYNYGSGMNIRSSMASLKKPIFYLLTATLAVCIVNVYLSPFLIELILPKYIAAIPFVGFLGIHLLIEPFQLYNTVLFAANKWKINIYTILAGLIVYFVAVFVLKSYFHGILAFIIANAVGRLVQLLLAILYLSRIRDEEAQ